MSEAVRAIENEGMANALRSSQGRNSSALDCAHGSEANRRALDVSRLIFNSQNSQDTRNNGRMLAKKLESLQEKIHFRKIKKISTESDKYLEANLQFNKRQENILLNALQFINDVAQRDK